jgi:hypothetical protein
VRWRYAISLVGCVAVACSPFTSSSPEKGKGPLAEAGTASDAGDSGSDAGSSLRTFIVALAGRGTVPRQEVYAARVGEGGALDAWGVIGTMPAARVWGAAAASGSWLTFLGGNEEGLSQEEVFAATVGADGPSCCRRAIGSMCSRVAYRPARLEEAGWASPVRTGT